jgi:hypothetical protein
MSGETLLAALDEPRWAQALDQQSPIGRCNAEFGSLW